MMESTVIGEQEKSCGILVKPADRVYALGNINEIQDDFCVCLVTAGDIFSGFV